MQERPKYNSDEGEPINYGNGTSTLSSLTSNPIAIAIAVLVISLGFTFWRTGDVAKDLVSNEEISGITENIEGLQKKVDDSINTIPQKVTDQVNQSLNVVSNQANDAVNKVNGIQNTVNSITGNVQGQDGKISEMASKVNGFSSSLQELTNSDSQLSNSLNDLKTRLASAEATIKELTTQPTQTPSSGTNLSTIPNVTIDVNVIDEGILYTANATRSEVKITMVNKGTKDVDDIMLELSLFIEDAADESPQFPRTVSSNYGSWSVRSSDRYEMILRGRNMRLNSGETRRIYVDLKTWGTLSNLNGDRLTTYTEFDGLEVMDWNYR